MNGYSNSRMVEARSLAILTPFIEEYSGTEEKRGRFVLIEKGPLAKQLQETIGDVLMNHRVGRLVSVEIKAEQTNRYNNLFLECWSNLNLSSANDWEGRGSNPGWAWKLHPGLLFYHFIEQDELFIFNGFKLWKWMHDTPSQSNAKGASRIHDFPRKPQNKYEQRNDTWGHCVPLKVLKDEVGFQFARPAQLSMFPVRAGAAA